MESERVTARLRSGASDRRVELIDKASWPVATGSPRPPAERIVLVRPAKGAVR